MTTVYKWLLGLEMAFLKFVLFKVGGGIESSKEKICPRWEEVKRH
jgi:hypothetical protein